MKTMLIEFVCLVVVPLAFFIGYDPDFWELASELFNKFSEHRRGTPADIPTCVSSRQDVAAPGFVPADDLWKVKIKVPGGNAHQRRRFRRAMARQGFVALLLFAACLGVKGQQPQGQGVQLSWGPSPSQCIPSDTVTCPAGTGATLVNIYRAPLPTGKTCAAVTTWTQIASGIAPAGPYIDQPGGGWWCYTATAYFAGVPSSEGPQSNFASVSLLALAPSGLKVAKQ